MPRGEVMMEMCYVVVRHDHEPDELAFRHAWTRKSDAEKFAQRMREVLQCRNASVEVIEMSYGYIESEDE